MISKHISKKGEQLDVSDIIYIQHYNCLLLVTLKVKAQSVGRIPYNLESFILNQYQKLCTKMGKFFL